MNSISDLVFSFNSNREWEGFFWISKIALKVTIYPALALQSIWAEWQFEVLWYREFNQFLSLFLMLGKSRIEAVCYFNSHIESYEKIQSQFNESRLLVVLHFKIYSRSTIYFKLEQFWLWPKKVCHQKLDAILGTKMNNMNDLFVFVNLR